MAEKIKILIVDDSLSIRLLLKGIFADAPDMEVISSAADPLQAIEEIKKYKPDVITLDVEMPQMDGITFLGKLMKLNPIPVVMISTLTAKGSNTAIKALELGAVDVIGKPSAKAEELKASAQEITATVRAAAYARVSGRQNTPQMPSQSALNTLEISPTLRTDHLLEKRKGPPPDNQPPLIAIGASTGGPDALRQLLATLPATLPGITIVQHMSPGFMTAFAERLNTGTGIKVCEAENSQIIEHGHAYIAPGGKHLTVRQNSQKKYICHIIEGDPINRHRPAVDILFRSVADIVGSSATGILLTGMGDDGARGLKEMKDRGAFTIAQDESSSVVFGMPRVAIKMGAADKIAKLTDIPSLIIKAH